MIVKLTGVQSETAFARRTLLHNQERFSGVLSFDQRAYDDDVLHEKVIAEKGQAMVVWARQNNRAVRPKADDARVSVHMERGIIDVAAR
jgi:hypothetical protein